MFENPRRGRQARNFTTNARSQIVFRTDIFPKIAFGCPCRLLQFFMAADLGKTHPEIWSSLELYFPAMLWFYLLFIYLVALYVSVFWPNRTNLTNSFWVTIRKKKRNAVKAKVRKNRDTEICLNKQIRRRSSSRSLKNIQKSRKKACEFMHWKTIFLKKKGETKSIVIFWQLVRWLTEQKVLL